MLKFDVMKVFINASAAIGIIVLWVEFSKKVFKKVCRLADETFSSSDCSDEEEGYWSDDCSEACPQIPKPPPPYYDCSEACPQISEPPPPYQLKTD